MADVTHQVFYCHCPLKCKGTSRLGSFFTYEEASEKVLWHLQKSEKHYMKEGEAAECLVDNADCIWEEEVAEKDLPQQNKGTADKGTRSGHSSGAGGQGQTGGSSSWRDGRGRRPEVRDRSRSRDARRSSSSIALRPAEVTQQKQAVYNFARVLGKCEAVIRTAARVARSASMAFEVGLPCLTSLMCCCCRN
jgi:hypothetical protein